MKIDVRNNEALLFFGASTLEEESLGDRDREVLQSNIKSNIGWAKI